MVNFLSDSTGAAILAVLSHKDQQTSAKQSNLSVADLKQSNMKSSACYCKIGAANNVSHPTRGQLVTFHPTLLYYKSTLYCSQGKMRGLQCDVWYNIVCVYCLYLLIMQ